MHYNDQVYISVTSTNSILELQPKKSRGYNIMFTIFANLFQISFMTILQLLIITCEIHTPSVNWPFKVHSTAKITYKHLLASQEK